MVVVVVVVVVVVLGGVLDKKSEAQTFAQVEADGSERLHSQQLSRRRLKKGGVTEFQGPSYESAFVSV